VSGCLVTLFFRMGVNAVNVGELQAIRWCTVFAGVGVLSFEVRILVTPGDFQPFRTTTRCPSRSCHELLSSGLHCPARLDNRSADRLVLKK
jgi:hypothetical protein